MKHLAVFLVMVSVLQTHELYAQSAAITLDECYTLAEQNYPLIKQRELIDRTGEYTVQNLSTSHMPQLVINGQATYQSAVTQVPISIPGQEIPTISKDQYKVYVEASQVLFDGGMVSRQKEAQQANNVVETRKLEVELYKLKERVNQLFFGILLVDEQLRQTELLKQDIRLGVSRTEASIANGTAFRSSLDILKAELLKADQRTIELKALRMAYADMLGLFINRQLNGEVTLVKPAGIVVSGEITRPEMQVFKYQAESLTIQEKILSARNTPKLSLFIQGGVGRPALNMLDNALKGYYIGGVRLNWSLSGLYTTRRERAIIDLSRRNIEVQKDAFVFNTNVTMRQQSAEVAKYSELLATDDEIVALRTSVKNTSSVQLGNGAITTNDYLREVNAEDQARQGKIVHEIQWLMAQYTLRTTTGIPNE